MTVSVFVFSCVCVSTQHRFVPFHPFILLFPFCPFSLHTPYSSMLLFLIFSAMFFLIFEFLQYEEAIEIFGRIIEKDKEKEKKKLATNFDTLSIFDMGPPGGNKWGETPLDASSILFNFDTVVTLEESITSAAVNNYAICALYLRRIKVSIDKLEGLIKDNPLLHLSDSIVFNLCTLYDLSCSPDISILRKTVLQKLSIKYHVDDPMLHWRSFRLN